MYPTYYILIAKCAFNTNKGVLPFETKYDRPTDV